QARGDIDPIAVKALTFDDDISDVDPDAKLHPALLWHFGISPFEFVLDLDCTLHGIDHAGKLGQKVIAGGVYHAATLLLNEGGHDRAIGSQGADGCLFILPHEAAVAFDIGTEDGGKFTRHSFPSRVRHSLFALHLVIRSTPSNSGICHSRLPLET